MPRNFLFVMLRVYDLWPLETTLVNIDKIV